MFPESCVFRALSPNTKSGKLLSCQWANKNTHSHLFRADSCHNQAAAHAQNDSRAAGCTHRTQSTSSCFQVALAAQQDTTQPVLNLASGNDSFVYTRRTRRSPTGHRRMTPKPTDENNFVQIHSIETEKKKKIRKNPCVSAQPPLLKISQDSVHLPPEALLIWAVLLAGRFRGRES